MKRFISLMLILAIVFTTSTFTNAASNEGTLLTKFIPISKPTLSFYIVRQYQGDKIVIYNDDSISDFGKCGLINLKGEVLLEPKYKDIYIEKNGDIKVNDEVKVYTYDKHMIPVSEEFGAKFDYPFFPNEGDKIDANTTFSYDDYNCTITTYNQLTDKSKTIQIDLAKYRDLGYEVNCYLDVLRYCKEINAFDCRTNNMVDCGFEDYAHLSCFDLNGNDVFENDLGVKAFAYIGDGYYFYEENGKKGIALLPGFKEKKVEKILRKPAPTKIKKIWKKKKASKKLKLSMQKVTNANGYYIKVYSSKKNAKKDKKALLSKKTKKTTITLKSKKLKKKKALYVKVRTYNQLGYDYMWSKWSAIKKVKIK